MKSLLIKSKWLISQCRYIALQLVFLIFLGVLTSFISVYRAIVIKNLIDSSISGNVSLIFTPLIILGSLIIGEIIINYIQTLLTTYCSTSLSNNIQKRLYSHITYSQWMEGSKYHSGDMISRILSDTSNVTNLIVNTLPNVISLSAMLISSFIILLSYEPTIAFLTIIIAPVSLLFGRFYAKKLRNIHLKTQENESKYLSFMQESIQNMLIVKTFCLEKNNLTKFNEIQNKKLKLFLSRSSISSLYSSTINFSYWLTYFLVFALGTSRLSAGVSTFGTLTALLQLTANVQMPLSGLASSLSQFITSYASTERLMEIEKLPLENHEFSSSTITPYNSPIIEYKDVWFEYNKDLPILKNISLTIFPGEIVALVGPSGEGKTTFIRLLLALLNSNSGSINFINDNESIESSPMTRHQISYVPQGNTLFSGTIEDNLKYGNLNATKEDILSALKAACAWDFVDKLPNKTLTIIGENGIGLSEGQAQRLVIARALIRQKPLLILDEATSALDMDTEVKVLEAIKNLDYHPTCIIITHRPSALAICNRVLKLDGGNIYAVDGYSIEESALGVM
ncbi:multidrug ABC transporter permease [Clostridium polyendosporum]|uniref:Multidrug ABC transporter permease n=1 Tax=Clostridium polyendosporum TaxID=69208 RepID=A0A919VCW9_9CLOT|nr:ABC transporter ATP-binding protein [Clostridium polyendosporum]GIM27389.1 multidrug ABC transporter permease [Clostridium polyendosporum]